MKKLVVLLASVVMGQLMYAQISPANKEEAAKVRKNETVQKRHHHKWSKEEKRTMMKQLNLSEEQKVKMKEMRASMKEKKASIRGNSALTEDQKKEQLKAMHTEHREQMKALLTEEQRAKMKKMKKDKKGKGESGVKQQGDKAGE